MDHHYGNKSTRKLSYRFNRKGTSRTLDHKYFSARCRKKWNSHKLCCVDGCLNRASAEDNISLHVVPNDHHIRGLWGEAVGKAAFAKDSRVCSIHFEENDFRNPKAKFKKLKPNAVPKSVIQTVQDDVDSNTFDLEMCTSEPEVQCTFPDLCVGNDSTISTSNGDMFITGFKAHSTPEKRQMLDESDLRRFSAEETVSSNDVLLDTGFKAHSTPEKRQMLDESDLRRFSAEETISSNDVLSEFHLHSTDTSENTSSNHSNGVGRNNEEQGLLNSIQLLHINAITDNLTNLVKFQRVGDGSLVMKCATGIADAVVSLSMLEGSDSQNTTRQSYGYAIANNLAKLFMVEDNAERRNELADGTEISVELQNDADNDLDAQSSRQVQKDMSTQTVPASEVYANVLDGIKTTDQLTSLTGLYSFELFNALCVSADAYEKRHNCHRGAEMDMTCRVGLTLVKLKTNLSFVAISAMFNISDRVASKYFKTTINLLFNLLTNFIPWPSRDEIRENLPRSFLPYANTRVVCDGTEIPVEKIKCISCNVQTYSNYKKRHTIKLMIGIAPSGLITYVSKLYGGKSSDKQIFESSDMVSKLEPGDAVMVDKGYAIEDFCTSHEIHMIRPPFMHDSQLSPSESEENRQIARARVHVERAIQRVKNFKMMREEIQWNLVSSFRQCVIVVCAIVNLSPPIMKDKSFEIRQ